MILAVPTYTVRAILRENCVVKGKTYAPGHVVSLPYGVALQGLAQGTLGAILDAETAHMTALEMLATYGGDAWFPPQMQTICKLATLAAETPTEAKH